MISKLTTAIAAAATGTLLMGTAASASTEIWADRIAPETEIDYWYFSVDVHSEVTFDVYTPGNSGLDSYIYLFEDDGSLNFNDYIAQNDDEDLSGGILDSYLEVTLEEGDYVLAIGSWDLDGASVIDGENDSGYTRGRYEIHVDIAPIPLPAALPLLAAGLGGLAFAGRRKRG